MFKTEILVLPLLILLCLSPAVRGQEEGNSILKRFFQEEKSQDANLTPAERYRAQQISILASLVAGEDVNKARRAATTLGEMGATAEPALPELKKLSEHPVDNVRAAIKEAIEKIETGVEKEKLVAKEVDAALPTDQVQKMKQLLLMIQGDNLNKARRSAVVLGKMGADAEPALNALRRQKNHPDELVRNSVNEAIGEIEKSIADKKAGKQQEENAKEIDAMRKRYQLMNVILGSDYEAARLAAQELTEMGNEAKPVLSDLRRIQNHPDAGVRNAIALAIKKIGQPGARYNESTFPQPDYKNWNSPENFNKKLTHLTQLVKGSDHAKARRAAAVLGNMGDKAAPALEALKEKMDHPNDDTRKAINEAIENIEASLA
ncbi:MAG: hypothetical protein KDA65_11165, partial [Planctomycetaceae bacterium]|nr:hypothetical protein [Planctomycetaceae bacterium]